MENTPSSGCKNCLPPPATVPTYFSRTERARVRLGFCGNRKVAVKEVVHKRDIDVMALRNDNIIKFYHQYDNVLVMEYAGGPTLAQVMDTVGNMREGVAIRISRGLTYLRSLSIVHKNIRPDNILLTSKLDVKIAGFGSDDRDCDVEWLAPELREDPNRYSYQSDIYNLGVLMEKMGEGSPKYLEWMGLCQSKEPNDRPLDCLLIQPPPEPLEVKDCEMSEEGLDMLESHALQGNSDIGNYLGRMYKEGFKVPIDKAKALHWSELAAKDHAGAQNTMGLHYFDTDPIAAEKWFLKAVENGYHQARSNLGRLMSSQNRHGKAKEWYRQALASNDAHAQYSLGEMYFRGTFVRQNDFQALELFHKAAVQGHADAQYSVGYMHQYERGTKRDDRAAEEWYMKAMKQGHIAAERSLAMMRNEKVLQQWAQDTLAVSMDVVQNLDTANVGDVLKNLNLNSRNPHEFFYHAMEERNKFIKNYGSSLIPVPPEPEEESGGEYGNTQVWWEILDELPTKKSEKSP